MLAWLLKLIGISSEITDNLGSVSFTLQRPTLFWIGMLLLVPVAYFIHRRQRTNLVTLPAPLRHVLTACRIAVLAIMVGVLAGPLLKLDHTLEKRPIVALLVDHSRSMNLAAGPFESAESIAGMARAAGIAPASGPVDDEVQRKLNEISRAELAHAAIETAGDSFVSPLAEKFELNVFGVGEELKALALDPAQPRLGDPPSPGGKRSPIGSAIVQVIEQAAGRQIAGIIVLSDGQNNGGASLSHAASAAAAAKAPVFAVPVGSSTRLRDVAIVDVFTSGLVSLGDTVSVTVTLESQGFDGQSAKIELREGETVLDAKDLTLRGAEQQQMDLTFEAKQSGAHYLTIQASVLNGEVVRENNQDAAFVRVDDQKLRVLYVEGQPRWDFRFLKNGMRRDHGLDASVVLETELKTREAQSGTKIPATVDEWAAYRTVILGDCSVETLTATGINALAEAVREKGVGLIVLAGPNQMPHAYDGTPLMDLLPVRARRGVAGYDAAAHNPFKMEITPAGAAHEALRLHDEPSRNAATWSQMPPYYWCAAIVRPAPGATVLATNPSIEDRYGKLPLIAYHYAGQGKVLFVATDSTWLWRQNAGDRFFYKFWGQTVRFVARHDSKDGKKSWIEVRPLRAQPGEPAEIELMAFTPDGGPRDEPSQVVTITGPGDPQVITLDADPVTKGRYLGRFSPKLEGDHHIRFQTNDSQESADAELHVEYAPEELRRPGLDRAALELLANHTGGQLIELTDLAKIPEKLHGETKFIDLHREESVWDNWLTLALLVIAYSLDVGIRRLTGLS